MKLSLLEKFANSARIRIQFKLSPHRLALLICNHRIGLSQIYRDLFRYILRIWDELSLPGLDEIVATGSSRIVCLMRDHKLLPVLIQGTPGSDHAASF